MVGLFYNPLWNDISEPFFELLTLFSIYRNVKYDKKPATKNNRGM